MTRSAARGTLLSLLVVAFGQLAGPGAAQAWTGAAAGGVLRLDAPAGEANRFNLADASGGDYTITDDGANAFAGPLPAGCSTPVAHRLRCPAAGVARIEIHAGDLDDTVENSSDVPALSLYGDDGADTLQGTPGADLIDGGNGADDLQGLDGGDVLTGGAGNDTLTGARGTDTLDGGPQDDAAYGGEGSDVIEGADGNDTLTGAAGTDELSGGAGDDTADGGDDADSLTGGVGADSLAGGLGNDAIEGGGGDDRVEAGDGADRVAGEDGNDALDGGAGGDTVAGGDGADVLRGAADADSLDGGPGADHLSGGDGGDLLAGGDGADVVDYGASEGSVAVSLNGAADDGAAGEGDNAAADLEVVNGGPGDDTLVGSAGSETLHGAGGADVLVGGDGGDTLEGGEEDDLLDGGSGSDRLDGGAGSDTVSYASRVFGVVVSLDRMADDGEPGENDLALAEGVIGGSGPDVLRGNPAADTTLVGGPANDRLITRGSAPGVSDSAECGDGDDEADTDGADSPGDDCERVLVDGAPPEVPGVLQMTAKRLSFSRRGGALVALRCAGGPGARCFGKLTLQSGSGSRARTLARVTYAIEGGRGSRVAVRLSQAMLRTLKRSPRTQGTLSWRDTAARRKRVVLVYGPAPRCKWTSRGRIAGRCVRARG